VKLVVASGKGGVGKSMLASSLALLYSKRKKVLAVDCDVDAANLGLWLGGIKEFEREEKVSTSMKAEIDEEKCIACGQCFKACRFKAIEKGKKYRVKPLLCEGCKACQIACPAGAVKFEKVYNGVVQVNERDLPFSLVSGKLVPGERCSGKLVVELRNKADKIKHEVMVLDAAAGIGCTVNASLVNTDFALLVTEPTPSGLSDLKRILKVVEHFKLPHRIVVNQWDINPEFSRKIEKFAGERLLGKIPYDKAVVDSIVHFKPLVEKSSPAAKAVKEIFKKLLVEIN
jgi:MinD superfamily P-loop ATPase